MSTVIKLNSHKRTERLSCKVSIKATDIIVYVPGTTDPFNIKDKIKESNDTYWDENVYFNTLVYDFKSQFSDLHINDKFTWTGDNTVKQRKLAGETLCEYLIKYYKGFLNRKLSIHFIGHSHGGLVINECTKHFKTHPKFPKKLWKVKSITYLSTPFFKTEHLPDITYYHKDCKIFAVNNKYDLTQRFIADFSLYQLPELLHEFINNDNIKALLKKISASMTEATWKEFKSYRMTQAELANVYTESRNFMPHVIDVVVKITEILKDLKGKTLNDTILDQLIQFFTQLLRNFNDARDGLLDRKFDGNLSRNGYMQDMQAANILNNLNRLLRINPTTYEARYLKFIDDLLVNQIDNYYNTVVTPPYNNHSQFSQQTIQVECKDPYHPAKEQTFDKFMSNIEHLETLYESTRTTKIRSEILIRLLSPLNIHPVLESIADSLDSLEWVITHDPTDNALDALKTTLRDNAKIYQKVYYDLVHPADVPKRKEDDFPVPASASQRGSIMYLAFISHSISRMFLDKKLEKGLKSVFDSGKNPGYKQKSWYEKHFEMEIQREQ